MVLPKKRPDIVKTCSTCQIHLPVPCYGINPRGLLPNQLWQMDVTHFPSFRNIPYVHVVLDACSGFLFATTQPGGTTHVISHCLQAFSVMGFPQQLKTDNGPGYASKAFAQFCYQFKTTHTTGIPYNPQGQKNHRTCRACSKHKYGNKKGELPRQHPTIS